MLHEYVERHRLGTVLVEAGYVLGRAPDTVRGPDVSFISASRLPPDQIPEQFISGAPDLAIEILSPSSRWPEVEEILADRPPGILVGEGVLDGMDVLPGFTLALADLFGDG